MSSPSQSHEPRSKVAAAVAAGKKKALRVGVCVCVNGGEERRIGTVGRGRGGGGKKGGMEKEGWRVKGGEGGEDGGGEELTSGQGKGGGLSSCARPDQSMKYHPEKFLTHSRSR